MHEQQPQEHVDEAPDPRAGEREEPEEDAEPRELRGVADERRVVLPIRHQDPPGPPDPLTSEGVVVLGDVLVRPGPELHPDPVAEPLDPQRKLRVLAVPRDPPAERDQVLPTERREEPVDHLPRPDAHASPVAGSSGPRRSRAPGASGSTRPADGGGSTPAPRRPRGPRSAG